MTIPVGFTESGAHVKAEFEALAGHNIDWVVKKLADNVAKYGLKPTAKYTMEKEHTSHMPLFKRKPDENRYWLDLALRPEKSNRTALRPAFVFDFASSEASMHIDEAKFKGPVRTTAALGGNAFWQVVANFKKLLPEIGIKKIRLIVLNDIKGGQENKISFSMMARLGVEFEPFAGNKPRHISYLDFVAQTLKSNFAFIKDLMTDKEKAAFNHAMDDPKHIHFKAIADLSRRIFWDVRNGELRVASLADRTSRPACVHALGDVLLDGLGGEAVIDLSKPIEGRFARLLERTEGIPLV